MRSILARSGHDALAMIEFEDGETCDIAVRRTPKEACYLAAKRLRTLADRFEGLAGENEPFNEATHRRVNR